MSSFPCSLISRPFQYYTLEIRTLFIQPFGTSDAKKRGLAWVRGVGKKLKAGFLKHSLETIIIIIPHSSYDYKKKHDGRGGRGDEEVIMFIVI